MRNIEYYNIISALESYLRNRIAAPLLAQPDRWALWLPVALIGGVLVYFSLKTEPAEWVAVTIMSLGLLFATVTWNTPGGRYLSIAVVAAGLGFGAAHWHTITRAGFGVAPIDRTGDITGVVVDIDPGYSSSRIVLGSVVIDGTSLAPRSHVRIRLTRGTGEVRPGDRLAVRAVLYAPPPPVRPGGYDSQRALYFQNIVAIGYAIDTPQIIDGTASRSHWISNLRHAIALRLLASETGRSAATAAALLTGERAAIDVDTLEALRVSGLAHLLAISGLHVGLVAGLVFSTVRLVLVLHPRWGLRISAKKVAAVVAILAAIGYMVLVGAPVPTQRAVLMTTIVMVAVILDRSPISLRLVAVAAGVVVLWDPSSTVGPSFQMSFAAVVGLVSAYEAVFPRIQTWLRTWDERSWIGRLIVVPIMATLLTSLVATLATAPFAAFHFHRLAVLGIVANIIAVPVMAFWVMPAGVLSLLLMPLGVEGPILWAMHRGIDVVLWVAEFTASMPGAAITVPMGSDAAVVALTLGALWIALWRGFVRWGGLGGVAVGIAIWAATPAPDILVGPDVAVVGITDAPGGRILLSTTTSDRFVTERWAEALAGADRAPWPKSGHVAQNGLRCDDLGCVLSRYGWTVALPTRPGAWHEDCRSADLIVSERWLWRDCTDPKIIDGRTHSDQGTSMIWLEDTGIRVVTDRHNRGNRPWVVLP